MLSSNIVIFRLICDWHSNVKFFELMVNILLCLGLSVAICLIFFCISNGAFVKTAVDQECSFCTRSESIIRFFWSLVLPMHTRLYLGFVSSCCWVVFTRSTDLNTPSLRIFDKSGCCSCMPLAFCKSFSTKKKRMLNVVPIYYCCCWSVVNECETNKKK